VEDSSKGGQWKYVQDQGVLSWSADSQHLAYTWEVWHKRGPGDSTYNIYRVDRNGDHKTSLTNDLPGGDFKCSNGWR
jgi:Tol biopolymer transport system component